MAGGKTAGLEGEVEGPGPGELTDTTMPGPVPGNPRRSRALALVAAESSFSMAEDPVEGNVRTGPRARGAGAALAGDGAPWGLCGGVAGGILTVTARGGRG